MFIMIKPLKLLESTNLKFGQLGEYKVLKNCPLSDSNGERIVLDTQYILDEHGRRCISADVFDAAGVKRAYNTFEINTKTKEFNGLWMKVPNSCDRKKHGYGEVLRLNSIVTLLENNLKKITIFSMNDAIPFHHKYKFHPVVSGRDEELEILNEISYEKNPLLVKQKSQSIKMMDEILISGMFPSLKASKSNVSAFLDDYLSEIEKNKIEWFSGKHIRKVNLGVHLNMELDRDTILKNRDFFNRLFEKHKFDYKI